MMKESAFDKLDASKQEAVMWRTSLQYVKALAKQNPLACRDQKAYADGMREKIAEDPRVVDYLFKTYNEFTLRRKMENENLEGVDLLSALLSRGSGERSR